ncbi:hypothetical protein SNEBB_010048 [Seison nebaliae]|nr:hypothetical protein SNEBB_010048 [Seison nebaliae]
MGNENSTVDVPPNSKYHPDIRVVHSGETSTTINEQSEIDRGSALKEIDDFYKLSVCPPLIPNQSIKSRMNSSSTIFNLRSIFDQNNSSHVDPKISFNKNEEKINEEVTSRYSPLTLYSLRFHQYMIEGDSLIVSKQYKSLDRCQEKSSQFQLIYENVINVQRKNNRSTEHLSSTITDIETCIKNVNKQFTNIFHSLQDIVAQLPVEGSDELWKQEDNELRIEYNKLAIETMKLSKFN